jgi:hypothetical protein
MTIVCKKDQDWLTITVVTIQVDEEAKYIIQFEDGDYETNCMDAMNRDRAMRFNTMDDAKRYIQTRWPEDSTWKGYWKSDIVYRVYLK